MRNHDLSSSFEQVRHNTIKLYLNVTCLKAGIIHRIFSSSVDGKISADFRRARISLQNFSGKVICIIRNANMGKTWQWYFPSWFYWQEHKILICVHSHCVTEYPFKEAYVRIFCKIASCNKRVVPKRALWTASQEIRLYIQPFCQLSGWVDTSLSINGPNNWCSVPHFPPYYVMFSKHFSHYWLKICEREANGKRKREGFLPFLLGREKNRKNTPTTWTHYVLARGQ